MRSGSATPWSPPCADGRGNSGRDVRYGTMTTPRQPKDPPAEPKHPAPEHGVPDGAEHADAKGYPNSDRHKTESAPGKIEKSSG
jgi:hypothetical protein